MFTPRWTCRELISDCTVTYAAEAGRRRERKLVIRACIWAVECVYAT